MRVHPRDLRLCEGVGERREPALRPPLPSVSAPERRVGVRGVNRDEDECALGDENRVHKCAVGAAHRLGERESTVCTDPWEVGMSVKRGTSERNEKPTREIEGGWAGNCNIQKFSGVYNRQIKQPRHTKCVSYHSDKVWERQKLIVR